MLACSRYRCALFTRLLFLKTTLQSNISDAEEKLDMLQNAGALLRANQDDIEDKKRRIESSNSQLKEQNFEGRLSEKNARVRQLESKRDEFTEQMRALSLQADSRARIEVNRASLQSKTSQMNSQSVWAYPFGDLQWILMGIILDWNQTERSSMNWSGQTYIRILWSETWRRLKGRMVIVCSVDVSLMLSHPQGERTWAA